MNISDIVNKTRQRFRMIKETNNNVKQILYNQKKIILEQNILNYTKPGISSEKYCNHDIIVSLTTYGKRLYDVHLVIESIMEQTMKANKIVLWLDDSFQNKRLPKALELQQKRGLEIKFCKDIRSYKKLIPSLKHYPEDAIITIDDDVIYEFDLLERLITSYLDDPTFIYCGRQHRMLLNEKKELLSYLQWDYQSSNSDANIMNFPTGCGGVLYPPNSLDNEVLNETIFMDICKYADDVWFKAMAIKKGTLSKKVYTHNPKGEDFIEIANVQDIALKNINTQGEVQNDKQIHDVFTYYNLYKLLK